MVMLSERLTREGIGNTEREQEVIPDSQGCCDSPSTRGIQISAQREGNYLNRVSGAVSEAVGEGVTMETVIRTHHNPTWGC